MFNEQYPGRGTVNEGNGGGDGEEGTIWEDEITYGDQEVPVVVREKLRKLRKKQRLGSYGAEYPESKNIKDKVTRPRKGKNWGNTRGSGGAYGLRRGGEEGYGNY